MNSVQMFCNLLGITRLVKTSLGKTNREGVYLLPFRPFRQCSVISDRRTIEPP